MKKHLIIGLLLAVVLMPSQAQTDFRERAKSWGIWVPNPQVTIDKKGRKTTAEWPATENNSWHEDIGIVDGVPTVKDMKAIFFGTDFSIPVDTYTPMAWRLTDEGVHTVLHCYLHMPADIVTNLWLGNKESVILDKETGIIYQSQGSIPERCYDKVFSVASKKGDVLDLQILFPRLPKTARYLAVYGVPAWHMRGYDISNDPGLSDDSGHKEYDSIPRFHTGQLLRDSVHYDKNNSNSWAVYQDAHLIKPLEQNTMALWQTTDATYLAIATEQNWFREYHGRGGNTILLDRQGHQYKCRGVLNYPNDRLFWLEGYPGDYFAMVLVFDPLPPHVDAFTYVVPEGEPFSAWGANWSGEVISNLSIRQLRENQRLFEYHPREVVRHNTPYAELHTNFSYRPGKYHTIVNKHTGSKMGLSFDYNLHATAYRDSIPSGHGPNEIIISKDKVFRFKFIPVGTVVSGSSGKVSKDCFIVTEDMFALEDGSDRSEGQWLIFRYLNRSNPYQQWKLIENEGMVTIINKATGRCVDLAGGDAKEGTAVFSYDINCDPQSNANQKWIIREEQ